MAEFVQQNIEEMLPELEQMARVKLFTQKETRTILKRRKGFEYKLKKQTKEKEDFLRYIQYEINVLALVRKRRQKIGYTFKRKEIDVAIVHRIHRLFRSACFRFQNDVKLWLSHIEFCKMRKEKVTVSKVFTKMLSVHNRKPALWILAAKWEMEDCMSMENARSLLQRGLRFNSQSALLWQEYFRMELLNSDKLRKRMEVLGMAGIDDDDEMSEAVLEGRVAELVFNKATEALSETKDAVKSFVSFLPICRLFDFTLWLEKLILRDLEERYGDKEETWDAVARGHLDRAARQGLSEEDLHQAYLDCHTAYETAVQKLKTEKMWTLYLTTCLQLLDDDKASKDTIDQRVHKAVNVFNQASNEGLLTENMFINWLDLLSRTGQVDSVDHVLSTGLEQHPKSVMLWKKQLQQLATQGDADKVLKTFYKSLEQVSEKDSLPLWEAVIDFAIIHAPGQLTDVLENGLCRCSEVCSPVKEVYLDWVAVRSGIKATRKLYKRLSATKPVSTEFFRKYINIELSQAVPKMKALRKAYEDMMGEYGNTNTDLWIDYVKLELNHSKGRPENAGQLHWRAIKTLDGPLLERFVQQYTLLQTGHL